MQYNILRQPGIAKIFVIYLEQNGVKKRLAVSLRYMGDKDCYFAGEVYANFIKPKNKTKVDIMVYTIDGCYKSTVKLLDATAGLHEVLYQLELPKVWNFIQLRSGTRKLVKLPGVLKFNDGAEFAFDTYDMAIGGFSFYSATPISNNYQRFTCSCSIEFPSDMIMSFPDRKLNIDVKFVRTKEDVNAVSERFFYALKFVSLSSESKIILKNYLLGLE